MLEANEGLENIFENAVVEAEKRRHEYVTIEHVLLALIKDESIGTTLTEYKVVVGALIKDVEDYLDTKCKDIVTKGKEPITPRKTASCFYTSIVPRQTRCKFNRHFNFYIF